MNNFIKICTLFFVFFGLIRHVYAAEEQLYVIDSPEITDSIESGDEIEPQITIIPVTYTHLTLPTILLV